MPPPSLILKDIFFRRRHLYQRRKRYPWLMLVHRRCQVCKSITILIVIARVLTHSFE